MKIEVTSNKQKVFDTKFGPAYHFGFKVGEDWFQVPFVTAGTIPFERGATISFMYKEEQNGPYTNRTVDKKSLEIAGGAPVQQAQPQQAQAATPAYVAPASNTPNSQRNTGITVGMAINNAVAILGSKATIDNIHTKAWEIVKLNDIMNVEVASGKCPFDSDVAVAPPSTNDVDSDFDDDIPF